MSRVDKSVATTADIAVDVVTITVVRITITIVAILIKAIGSAISKG